MTSLEELGLVCLPVAGYRIGSDLYELGVIADHGCSVRLVTNVE